MVSRNLPPSFFNANYHMKGVYGGDIYSDYPSSLHHLAAHGATTDPWQYAQVIHLYSKTRVCQISIFEKKPVSTLVSSWKLREQYTVKKG